MYDVVIIGAGITGTMLARKLSAYDLKVALIDKENDIANGATMANSAIIHTGYDPADGTLMAKLNVAGANAYEQLCADLGCKYKTVGAYISACGDEEERHLDVLADRARRRGIPYRFVDMEEARKEEPNLSQNVTRVLDFYTTAVVYPWEIAIACAEVAVGNGVELYLNSPCEAIDKTDNGYIVRTPERELECKLVVNAAGVYAEKIAKMVSGEVSFHITPRRGEYYVLDKDADFVRHIIFPVPSKEKGKGVLAVPTVFGNTLIGPNSDYVDEPDDNGTSDDGLAYVRGNISKTLDNVPLYRSIRTFAGLRPSSSAGDFVIEEAPDAAGFVNAACIESPGLASAPGVADYIIGQFISKRLDLTPDDSAVMSRQAPLTMEELSAEERSEAIKNDPLYGRMICRCEQISEGEIVDCIRRPCGARTVKGVKKRVRPGMGRCQGGFCEPKVLEILAREL
ncbi:MAG: NAD(P)/FAD-dependent oxidoreductase, partial [Ruminococcus sp.]|nr:NAD(P)/FAD-dependent oxidoreductase [Ruminococcus sp.]